VTKRVENDPFYSWGALKYVIGAVSFSSYEDVMMMKPAPGPYMKTSGELKSDTDTVRFKIKTLLGTCMRYNKSR
jgi:hypothetical protein